MRVAIIGAGLAGLTAANELRHAGLSPVVFDKSRGVGGRLSTRRAEGGLQFDHGAQYLSPNQSEFAAFLELVAAAGVAAMWTSEGGEDRYIGHPGMSSVAKHLAQDLDIQHNVNVTSIDASKSGWSVAGQHFDRVISAIPAPQAVGLLTARFAEADMLRNVVMDPNLTLMLAVPKQDNAITFERNAEGDIAWIALDSLKHGRSGPDCWVVQAGTEWSRAHLELEKDDIAAAVLALVAKKLGLDGIEPLYLAGHRWRYAFASEPLGQHFLSVKDTLFFGGDWTLSERAESAFASGRAMAAAVLDSR